MISVLIVEDNHSLAGNIIDFLELKGLRVDYAENGRQCINLLDNNEYDVIVLDVMMPGMDGYQTCQHIRTTLQHPVPILFLTAKCDIDDKIQGFELGADDYLAKPFEMQELLYRIKALSIRGQRRDMGRIQHRDVILDLNNNALVREEQTIELSKIQVQIMSILISEAPNTITRSQLETRIWGDDLPDSDVLKVHIYQLRKIIDKPFSYNLIETVHSRGYRIKP